MTGVPEPSAQGQEEEETKEEPEALRIQVELHEVDQNENYIVSMSTKDRPTTFGYKEFNATYKKYTEAIKAEL